MQGSSLTGTRGKLTVHAGKAEAMILSPKIFIGPLRPILYGTSVINYVKQSTSLGIIIVNKLSREKQLAKVTNSFNGKMKELKRLRYLRINIQEEIYFKTVVSAATYCITLWGTSSPAIQNAVAALHARAAKTIHKIKGEKSTEEILNKAGWEPISYIYKKRILTWIHRIYYKTCPKQIYEQFSERKTNLRNPLQVEVIRYKKEIGRNSFKYRGGVLWNLVNNNLKSQENMTTLKKKIEEYKENVN